MDSRKPVENADSIVIPAIWSMVGITTAFFSSKIYTRITRSGQTWWDDYLLIIGWILLIAAGSTLTVALKNGHLISDSTEAPTVSALVRLSHTFHLFALALSKTSFAVSLLRFSSRVEKVLIWLVVGSINLLTIYHVFAQWRALCGDTVPYVLPGSCWEAHDLGIVNITGSGFSAATDFVLGLLPWRVIWNTNLEKKKRIGVGVAMSFEIVGCAFGVMKTVQAIRILNPLELEFNWHLMLYWIFSLAEPCSTIIAASIPILRVLVGEIALGTRYGSTPTVLGYVRSDGNRFLTQPRPESRRNSDSRHQTFLDDTASESSILDGRHGHRGGGITLKTEVSVEFDRKPDHQPRLEMFELRPGVSRSNSVKVKGKDPVVLSSPPLPQFLMNE
ncbi:unnamed protein product [Clonostachys rosea f. rosea IK726]|uniref:Uncharacterized protein n=1 Tax=Clonostachys rosea f. rosea IK726 TaxID=1349383 RepID=A0ACA9URR8_BIOOC|nr:unnamed protein product [Clonostachys rosea f. rosea IK726]